MRSPFIGDEVEIKRILAEAARIASPTGAVFVAFYRASAVIEELLTELGLLHNHVLLQRQALEMNRLNSLQTLGWVAKQAGVSHLRAALLLLRVTLFSTLREKMNAVRMKKIFRKLKEAGVLIESQQILSNCRLDNSLRKSEASQILPQFWALAALFGSDY